MDPTKSMASRPSRRNVRIWQMIYVITSVMAKLLVPATQPIQSNRTMALTHKSQNDAMPLACGN
jgi:hypothetical protein